MIMNQLDYYKLLNEIDCLQVKRIVWKDSKITNNNNQKQLAFQLR